MSRSLAGGVAMLVVCAAWSVAAVEAAPPGYASDIRPGADGGVSALAYGPDGTLYVADTTSGAVVRYPPGGDPSVLNIVGATLQSVGGMCVSPDASTLYITDNKAWGDGEGDLYAVDLLNGAVTTLVAGMDFIDDVAVRHTGEVFISEAAGPAAGGVYLVVGSGGGVVPVVSGLDYAAGLAFDSAGDLIYQQATSSFVGEVFRLPITQAAGGLAFGPPVPLASGLAAAFDLATDGEDDVFVTGSGGVYELDRDGAGNFLGTASPFEAHGFSTEVAFLAGGSNPFEPGAGYDGGHLTFVPEYASTTLVDVTTVPEPAALGLLGGGALWLLRRDRRRRRLA